MGELTCLKLRSCSNTHRVQALAEGRAWRRAEHGGRLCFRGQGEVTSSGGNWRQVGSLAAEREAPRGRFENNH